MVALHTLTPLGLVGLGKECVVEEIEWMIGALEEISGKDSAGANLFYVLGVR